jgi:hypothetical protein
MFTIDNESIFESAKEESGIYMLLDHNCLKNLLYKPKVKNLHFAESVSSNAIRVISKLLVFWNTYYG